MKKCICILTFLLLILIVPVVYAEDYLVGMSNSVVRLLSADSTGLEPVAPSIGVYSTSDKALAERLLAEGFIDYIEEDEDVQLLGTTDTYFSRQWNMLKCGIPAAREITRGSGDVVVGIVDSGFQTGHPDFSGNIVKGYNAIDGSDDVTDDIGHGTAVAGIIGAASDNGVGIAGIADNVKIMPVNFITQTTGGKVSQLVKGIEYAIDNGCDVINLSLAVDKYNESLKAAIDRAYEKNIIVVAAVGNDGNNSDPELRVALKYPAAYDSVIGVGATDSSNTVAAFSQRNNSVFICAPGKSVPSTMSFVYYGDMFKNHIAKGYATVDGTSFSAPHIAALAAMAKSIYPDLTPDEFMVFLRDTATDLGYKGYDTDYGYGLVNMDSVLRKVQEFSQMKPKPFMDKMTSEIVSSGSGSSEFIRIMRNNTVKPISGKTFTAVYDNDTLEALNENGLTVKPFGIVEIPLSGVSGKTSRQFFWSDDMQPLLPVCEY